MFFKNTLLKEMIFGKGDRAEFEADKKTIC